MLWENAIIAEMHFEIIIEYQRQWMNKKAEIPFDGWFGFVRL